MRNKIQVEGEHNLFVGMLPKDMRADELKFILNSILGGGDFVQKLRIVKKGYGCNHDSAFVLIHPEELVDVFYNLKKNFFVTKNEHGYCDSANRFYGDRDALLKYKIEKNDDRKWTWLNFEIPMRRQNQFEQEQVVVSPFTFFRLNNPYDAVVLPRPMQYAPEQSQTDDLCGSVTPR